MEIYLDHAATTRILPESLRAMVAFEEAGRGNPFRGLHASAERATMAYESARVSVAEFLGASSDELIFTKGATEGLNMLAQGLAHLVGPGDEIVLSLFEHHANMLPWRMVADMRGCTLRFVPLTSEGLVDVDVARGILSSRTKIVAMTHVSNVLGSIVPIKEIATLAHEVGALVCVDGAQAVGHMPVRVHELGVDAYALSAHKLYGPMGIGALFATRALQARLHPFLLGGGMVEEVFDDGCSVFAEGVRKFEAGTPNVTGAVGFSAACVALAKIFPQIVVHEAELADFLWHALGTLSQVTRYGPPPGPWRTGVVSFSLQGVHPHDVAQSLADEGIAVRAGFHCSAPLARCLHRDGVVRVSVGKDTTLAECETFVRTLTRLYANTTL